MGMNARVGRFAENFDRPVVCAQSTDCDFLGVSTVDVKAHGRIAQFVDVDVSSPPKPTLFPNRKEKSGDHEDLLFQQRGDERDEARDTRAIVATQRSEASRHDAISFFYRDRSRTKRDRVEVGREESARSRQCPCERDD